MGKNIFIMLYFDLIPQFCLQINAMLKQKIAIEETIESITI